MMSGACGPPFQNGLISECDIIISFGESLHLNLNLINPLTPILLTTIASNDRWVTTIV